MLENKFFRILATIIIMLTIYSCSNDDNTEHFPPEKPSGLAAEANYPSGINLSWDEDTSSADIAKYYYVFYSENDSLGDYFRLPNPVYGNEASVTGLLYSTKYYFKLLAVNNYGSSDTSDIVSVKTLIEYPKNLKTTLLPNDDLLLEWDKVIDNSVNLRGIGDGENETDGVKYKVYLDDEFAGETADTRMKFSNLDKTKLHKFNVSAVDKDGREGGKSSAVTAGLLGDLPSTPQGLSVTLQSSEKVVLSWKSVEKASEYRVYYSTAPEISYEYYAPTTDTAMTVNIVSGIDYYFKVSAVNSSGEGEKSEEVSLGI